MDDLRLASLLCTRLCHDLVGPVGAMNNGLELITDPSEAIEEEVIDLLRQSGRESARRLRFFRAAFGLPRGRGDDGGLNSARGVASHLFEESKIELDWPEDVPPPLAVTEARIVQLVLNMILCASEMLPRGGSVAVRSDAGAGTLTVRVAASGPSVKVTDALRASLAEGGDGEDFDPRNAQSYLTARLANAVGAGLELIQPSRDSAELVATLAGGV